MEEKPTFKQLIAAAVRDYQLSPSDARMVLDLYRGSPDAGVIRRIANAHSDVSETAIIIGYQQTAETLKEARLIAWGPDALDAETVF